MRAFIPELVALMCSADPSMPEAGGEVAPVLLPIYMWWYQAASTNQACLAWSPCEGQVLQNPVCGMPCTSWGILGIWGFPGICCITLAGPHTCGRGDEDEGHVCSKEGGHAEEQHGGAGPDAASKH